MVTCPVCSTNNPDGASVCRECGKTLAVALHPQEGPIPDALRAQVGQLINREIAVSEPPVPVLVELASKAAALADVGSVPRQALRVQIEQALGRPIGPSEPTAVLIEQLIAKTASLSNQPVSTDKTSLGDLTTSHVKFPALVASALKFVPDNFKWVAALALPLLLGGGSGFMFSPTYKPEASTAEIALSQARSEITNLNAALAAETSKTAQLTQESARVRQEQSDQTKALNTPLEQLRNKNADLQKNVQDLQQKLRAIPGLQQNLAAANVTIESLRPFTYRGFAEWKGNGAGRVTFSPIPDRGTLEGMPPDGKCTVVDVIGAELLRDRDCTNFAINLARGRQNDKRVLIVWQRRN